MAGAETDRNNQARAEPLGRTVLHDLRNVPFRRTFARDLRDVYNFYLDHERRKRLADMNTFSRALHMAAWLAKSLVLNLSPARRIVLLAALLLTLVGRLEFRGDRASVSVSMLPVALVLLLFVLMLELKDKLLARDELAVGRQVQLALLPRDNPTLPGWHVYLFTQPANDVGGDLVDYLRTRDGPSGELAIVLGDVAGKGLGAALLMAKLQATLRAFAPEADALDALGARTNAILCRDGLPNRFATLVYAVVGAGAGRVRLLNAGHLPVAVVHATGVRTYPATSMPLGIVPYATFFEQGIDLAPGEKLVIYSDGVTEARNESGDFFGDERLLSLLRAGVAMEGAALGQRIVAAVEHFTGDEPQSDDVSLVIVERRPVTAVEVP